MRKLSINLVQNSLLFRFGIVQRRVHPLTLNPVVEDSCYLNQSYFYLNCEANYG